MSDRKIETLDGGEHVRLRWSMYLDADTEKALQLALREIWVNSCDELTFRKRKGTVNIKLDSKKREMTVSDDGNGIPANKLADVYLTTNTGSNFFEREGNLAGAMGIGLKAVSHTAAYVYVSSNNGNDHAVMNILYGEKQGELKGDVDVTKNTSKKSGVTTVFCPAKQIYGDTWINEESLLAELDEAAKFYPLITFNVEGDFGKKTIAYPKGLNLKETEAYYESENLIVSLSLESGQIKPFGNRLHLKDGGAFYTHFKSQFTRAINDTIDFKINGSELQAALSGYVAVFVTEPVFSNQQKSAIGNKEVNFEITSAVKQIVEQLQKSKNWQKFITALETEMKAEEAAEKARNKVKNALAEIDKGAKSKAVALTTFKDCIQHGPDSWLFICEGKSAVGSLALARGPKEKENIALVPIRGKIINCLKNKPERFLENEEIKALGKILGCGFFEKYNAKKLRFGNVGITVDADEDGKSIFILLLVMFYICMPEMLKEGRIHWIRMPLYSKDGKEFIYTEEDWKKVKNKKGYTRNKGLGEMNGDEMALAAFGEQRRWEQLKIKNWTDFSNLIEELMGKDVSARRERLMTKVDFERIKFL